MMKKKLKEKKKGEGRGRRKRGKGRKEEGRGRRMCVCIMLSSCLEHSKSLIYIRYCSYRRHFFIVSTGIKKPGPHSSLVHLLAKGMMRSS